jgi:rubrerythrin
MSITFNADEIFEMAEEIERNAARFYRQAVKYTLDKKTKQMLLDFAVMEDEHLYTFKRMRSELSEEEKEQTVFDPDNEAAMYLQTMAGSRGTEGRKSQTEELDGSETIEQIIKIATNSEKNSIVFYVGLKDLVPSKMGKDKVGAIIKEEMAHLARLNQYLIVSEKN